MKATAPQQYKTKAEWLKGTKADLRVRNRKEKDFALRLTGLVVGTCPMTVGYIAKSTDFITNEVKYYACKELVSIFHGWQWHMCYHTDINAAVKSKAKKYAGHKKEHTILVTDSLTKAINFLKLDR